MIEVSKCIICDGIIRRLKKALVAPFIAHRIWNREPFCVELVQCTKCGFLFYNPRLDGHELGRLYANYRSDEYLALRHSSEIWYTRKFNEDLASSVSYRTRRTKLSSVLQKLTAGRTIRRVLDHCGDRGDLIAGLFEGAEAFVYDISGVRPAAGIVSVKSVSECKPDLIINSNVLEHVGQPRTVVSELLEAAQRETLIFFEVPCEKPLGTSRLLRRFAQISIMAISRPWLARRVLRPSALFMMHEHINYFTEETLIQLVKSSGGSVIASGTYALSGRAGNSDMAWCLGMRAQI